MSVQAPQPSVLISALLRRYRGREGAGGSWGLGRPPPGFALGERSLPQILICPFAVVKEIQSKPKRQQAPLLLGAPGALGLWGSPRGTFRGCLGAGTSPPPLGLLLSSLLSCPGAGAVVLAWQRAPAAGSGASAVPPRPHGDGLTPSTLRCTQRKPPLPARADGFCAQQHHFSIIWSPYLVFL